MAAVARWNAVQQLAIGAQRWRGIATSSGSKSSSGGAVGPGTAAARPRLSSLGTVLPEAVAAKLVAYPSTVTLPMLWGFQDGYGHVNNVHYMRFLESARMQYFVDVASYLDAAAYRNFIDGKTIGPILASASINYKAPVTFPDLLTIGARVGETREDRFSMTYAAVSHNSGRVVCDGDSWIVTYDYRILRKAPIPTHILDAMDRHVRAHAALHPPAASPSHKH